MIAVAIGVLAAGVIWLAGRVYVWREIGLFDSNLRELIEMVESNLRKQPMGRETQNERDDFNRVRRDALAGYKRNKRERLRRVHGGIVLFAITAGYLTFCIAYIAAGGAFPFLAVLPTPLVVIGAWILYTNLVNSDKCCVYHSTSSANPILWLGLILPSISIRGTLRLVLGSMTPYPFSKGWFRDLLVRLEAGKKVSIRIVSGKQELERMNQRQREAWVKCWGSFNKDFLKRNFRIIPGRPELQYTVTDRLVRVEEDHPPWIVREQEGIIEPVQNHLRLYNFSLIKMYNAKFDASWNQGEPVAEDFVSSLGSRRS